MAYRALRPSSVVETVANSFMAKSGVNKRDLPQLLNANFALEINNYLITAEGGLEKRKGRKEVFDAIGVDGLTMLEEWFPELWIFGYGTNLKAYDKTTDTITSIKTDFVEAHFAGEDYGNYFMVASPQDKVGRISLELDFDAQTSNFTVGLVVTGATSGATAVILEQVDGGATGTLTLGDIVGVFENNEVITDSSTGSADVNGILSFTFTSITAAPKAKRLTIIGANCHVGDLEGARDAVQMSNTDTGTNPPFNDWDISTVPTEGDLLNYRAAGIVNDIIAYSKFVVVLAEKGWWSYYINIIDSAGTPKRNTQFNMYRKDGVGATKAIMTDVGIFYVNATGIHRLIQLQQENVNYSQQEELVSELLGNKYFADVNFDDMDLAYLSDKNTLLISCRKDSLVNNLVIAYNTKQKAFSFFKGWAITAFMQIGLDIYGASATNNKVYKLFEGNDDDGANIWTRFYQEVNLGGLNNKKAMFGQYFQGDLSDSSEIDIAFDIYDKLGFFIERKANMTWTADATDSNIDEYGNAEWGDSVWGGDQAKGGTTGNYAGGRLKIRNLQRLRVDITEHSKVPHTINFFSLLTTQKAFIRKRNLKH